MLQDTFGYEERADRLAIEAFGIKPDALKRGLWKFHNRRTLQLLQLSGLSISDSDSEEQSEVIKAFSFEQLAFHKCLSLGLKLYLAQYLGTKHSGYWHPSVAHRIALWIKDQI